MVLKWIFYELKRVFRLPSLLLLFTIPMYVLIPYREVSLLFGILFADIVYQISDSMDQERDFLLRYPEKTIFLAETLFFLLVHLFSFSLCLFCHLMEKIGPNIETNIFFWMTCVAIAMIVVSYLFFFIFKKIFLRFLSLAVNLAFLLSVLFAMKEMGDDMYLWIILISSLLVFALLVPILFLIKSCDKTIQKNLRPSENQGQ